MLQPSGTHHHHHHHRNHQLQQQLVRDERLIGLDLFTRMPTRHRRSTQKTNLETKDSTIFAWNPNYVSSDRESTTFFVHFAKTGELFFEKNHRFVDVSELL